MRAMRPWPLLVPLLACRFVAAPTPMAMSLAPSGEGAPARCLLVLLPGGGDPLGQYAEEGFVAAIRGSGLDVDVVATDAQIGYYARGVVGERLERDVVAPLRPGHEHVWLLGVSLGGYGAMHYAQQYPARVDGVVVLAPYVGGRKILKEVEGAGGLARWTADPPAPLTRDNYQRQLWGWLQRQTIGGEKGPVLLLGYGTEDRLARGHAMLAAALPGDRVFTRPGGHDWPVWRGLLAEVLRHPALIESCAAKPSED